MRYNLRFPLAALFLSTLLIIPNFRVKGMPAFARKYQISCQVCHSPIPRLKPFGEEFAGNGFRLTEFESPRYFIPSGDDRLSLLRELPLAVRFDGLVSMNFGNKKAFDLGTPFGLKIISGGELTDHLSYYFYFYLNERGEISGVEDALLIYNNLFGSGINVSLGQFQACDPLYKRETRLTLEDYKIYTTRPGNSSIALKYDKGFIVDYGLKTGTDLVLLVLNGSGIGEASEDYLFDKDKYKNIMGKISQSIGKSLSIGLFGYSGKEILREIPAVLSSKMWMFGPNLSIDINEKFIVKLQYLKRSDSNVYIEADDRVEKNVMTQGGFAEIIYSPKGDNSKWYLTGLLNLVDSDLDILDYKSATLHAGYVLRRNVRLVSEYTWLSGEEEYGRFSLGFVSSF